MEEDKTDNDVGTQVMDADNKEALQSKEVDDKVEDETVAGDDAKQVKKEEDDEKVVGEGNREDEKENEDVKVVEEDKREDEKVAEDLMLAGDKKVVQEGEKEDIMEAENEKVVREVKREVEKEEEGEKENGEADEKVAEEGKKDEKKQKNEKGTEEGENEVENGEEDVKMAEREKENEKEYIEGEMEEETKSLETEGVKVTRSEDMVEAKLDEMTEKERIPDKPKVGKGTKRSRANNSAQKSDTDKKRKIVAKERELETPKTVAKETTPKTHTPSLLDRPVRERKSVERLVAIIEKDSARDIRIEKGRGTSLKDIPNVAHKLSKKKNADTLKLLHTILFARREKAAQIKNNISRFSGFVWHDDEEKQMIKVKEKLDKCVKEKLIDFCDVLDIPVSKTRSRKEDVISKLIDFLMEPHATASELLADKEQSSKGKKRRRGSGSAPGSNTPPINRSSSKSTPSKGGEAESSQSESEEDIQEMDEDKDLNAVPEKSGDEVPEKAGSKEKQCESEQALDEKKGKKKQVSEKSSAKKRYVAKAKTKEVKISNKASLQHKKSLPKSPKSGTSSPEKAESKEKQCESEPESDEEKGKMKQVSGKSSAKKRYVAKAKTKEVKISNKASPPHKKSLPKSPKTEPRKKDDKSGKKSSGKTKDDDLTKKSTPKEWASSESIGKKLLKVRDKYRENNSGPSDNELRIAISEILKEVDFTTATFADILKLLVKQFDADLTPRKSSIKSMIQDELTKLAEEDEDEDGGDADKDEKKSSTKGIEA